MQAPATVKMFCLGKTEEISDQVGLASKQPDLIEDIPAHGRGD